MDNYDVFGTFRANVAAARSSTLVQPMISPSLEAASVIKDGFLDLVFIDAGHSYEAVKSDIAAWKPKVRSGGVLCGHDYEVRINATNRDWINTKRGLEVVDGGGTSFRHVHPEVIAAVDDAFGDRVNLFAEKSIQLLDGTSGNATIWYVVVR